MIRRRRGEPLGNTMPDRCGRKVQFSDGPEEARYMLIEDLLGRRRRFGVGANIDSAAMAAFGPAVVFKLAVTGADGVGMDVETSRKFVGTRQPVTGAKIAGQNRQNNLGNKLPIKRNFAAGGRTRVSRGTSGLL